ncbi:MAG: response regulator [Bacteroidota bacterium]
MLHKKILLVDDDADDLHFFFEAIKEIDPTLICAFANNGLEAIEHLNKVPPLPSLIFLDLNMPGMSGIEFIEKIRPAYKTLPVVMYTTSSAPEDKIKTRAAGANYFLTKQSDFHKIKAQLLEVLEMDLSV